MFPDWFTKPEFLFNLLWSTIGIPILLKVAWPPLRNWFNGRTEDVAKYNYDSLCREIEDPPTLLQSVAMLVCWFPVPVFLAGLPLTMLLTPEALTAWLPPPLPPSEIGHAVIHGVVFVIALALTVLFGVLSFYGIRLAIYLRKGEKEYQKHWKAGVQKQIDRLTKKYPSLRASQSSPASAGNAATEPSGPVISSGATDVSSDDGKRR